jgi:hypothetical protein
LPTWTLVHIGSLTKSGSCCHLFTDLLNDGKAINDVNEHPQSVVHFCFPWTYNWSVE